MEILNKIVFLIAVGHLLLGRYYTETDIESNIRIVFVYLDFSPTVVLIDYAAT